MNPEEPHTYQRWIDSQDIGNTCCLRAPDDPIHIPRANDNEGPFSFGSDLWPGLSKLGEECGEVVQVVMKLIATGGRVDHWSGVDLGVRLEEELGDLRAAIDFVLQHNRTRLDLHAIQRRTVEKRALFVEWHGKPPPKPGLEIQHFHDGRPCYVRH